MFEDGVSRDISLVQQKLLDKALLLEWPVPVTGFLINARFDSGSLIGVVWHHRKAGLSGSKFADGHLIITSAILGYREYGDYWLFRTLNSHYVVINFSGDLGSILVAINAFRNVETLH